MDHPSALLRSLGSRARKSLGQHFLASESVVDSILRVARVGEGSRVVEVGPGLGIMTERLLASGAAVTAVELDRDLAAWLRERLPALTLVEADATSVDWPSLVPQPKASVVANLPYNAGTRILLDLLAHPELFDQHVLMVQKEVALRLVAPPGDRKRGSLSVHVQARAEARQALNVPPGAFYPPPRVDSAVVHLVPRVAPELGGMSPELLEEPVRAGFAQPRKMLRASLGSAYGKAVAAEALDAAGVDPTARPAVLGLADWVALARALPASPGPS